MNTLLYAQDLLKARYGGEFGGGFNSRVAGWTKDESYGYPAYRSPDGMSGWYYADKLISAGKIFYRHRFKHTAFDKVCDGYAFPYGGTWVCNTCGRSAVDEPWWDVKVMKDGDAWCCIGTGFVNLQESSNYAFGDTQQEALDNYEKLMLATDEQGRRGSGDA